MAILKQRLNRKNSSGTYDTIYLETAATVVKMSESDSTKLSDKISSMDTAIAGKQPKGSYAAANHNHNGVYQPAGSYAKPTDIPAALRGEYGTPLEMGKYIDFHTINSTADYDARLTCTNSWLSVNDHRIVAVTNWDGTNLYLA